MLVMTELGVQIINLAFYIIPNAVLASIPCSGVFKWLIGACAGVRWTCWNTVSQGWTGPSVMGGQPPFWALKLSPLLLCYVLQYVPETS